MNKASTRPTSTSILGSSSQEVNDADTQKSQIGVGVQRLNQPIRHLGPHGIDLVPKNEQSRNISEVSEKHGHELLSERDGPRPPENSDRDQNEVENSDDERSNGTQEGRETNRDRFKPMEDDGSNDSDIDDGELILMEDAGQDDQDSEEEKDEKKTDEELAKLKAIQ